MRPLPTFRQLAYLVAVAEHRHFGRAAEACFVTQSTLSTGVQELETLLGVVLVERTKRRVSMTPLGEEVAARAKALLRGGEELVEAARAGGEPLAGPLRLGVIPTISPYLLPKVLPRLREHFPLLRLYLREDQSARIVDGLAGGDLDALILALPFPAEDTETMPLGDDPFLFICRPDHRLARCPTIEPAEMANEPLLLLEDGHCLRDHALAACRLPGARAGQPFSATSLATLVQMVAGGLGVTLVPRMAALAGILAGTNLIARPMAASATPRGIGLVWRRSSPRKAEFRLLAAELAEGMI